MLRLLPLAVLALSLAAACRPLVPPEPPRNPPIQGLLTGEGVECPTMRGDDGRLYALLGDLRSFGPGDRVCVVPSYVEMSFCMQETTVHTDWIGPAPCP